MKSLYDELGVEKTASRKEIHEAYKKKAKGAHPDAPGGSAQKFAVIKRARDVLHDDAKRAHYDETGRIEEPGPDQKMSKAMEAICNAFEQVLDVCQKHGKNPLELNLVYEVGVRLGEMKDELQKNLNVFKNVLEFDRKLKGRFKTKKKKNIFEGILQGRYNQLEQRISAMESGIAALDEARNLIDGHTFDKEIPDRAQGHTTISMQQFFNQFSQRGF